MIDKNIVDKKVFASEKNNYDISIVHPDFLLDKEVYSSFDHDFYAFLEQLSTQSIREKIDNKSIRTEALEMNERTVIATFIPIYNIERDSISYLISFEESTAFTDATYDFILQLTLVALLIFLVLGVIHYLLERSTKITKRKEELDKLVEQRTAELRHIQREKLQNYEDIILAMVNLTEMRDTYTAGHTKRVAKYVKLIAKEMQYSYEQIQLLYEETTAQ